MLPSRGKGDASQPGLVLGGPVSQDNGAVLQDVGAGHGRTRALRRVACHFNEVHHACARRAGGYPEEVLAISLLEGILHLNSEVAQVNEARREAAELVRPVLEARHAAYASSGASAVKHDDFIQWIMDSYHAGGKTVTPDETVQNIFIVMFASMHGTSFVALQALFSLVNTPGAFAGIREEIGDVSRRELGQSPVWTRHALGELRKLDSFMRETLRIKPFQEGKWSRYRLLLLQHPWPMVSVCTGPTQPQSNGTP